MPALPSWAAAWLTARLSGDAMLALVTISHRQWGAPVRLVRNTADLVSRGHLYQKAYFDLDVVADSADGRGPAARISVPNVSRDIGLALLDLISPPEVAIELVSSAHPDEPVYRAARLELRSVTITAVEVTGELASRDYAQEPLGRIMMTPARAPGLFKRRH